MSDNPGKANVARLFRVPELGGTEALAARFTTQRFRPHFHETYLVGVTVAGAECFEARGGRHLSPAGSLRMFNPGEVHTGQPPENGHWAYRCLYPPADLVAEIGRELGLRDRPWFPEMIVPDPDLGHELLVALTTLESPASQLERTVRLHTALSRIIAAHSGHRPVRDRPDKPEPRAVAAAQAFIGDHVAQDFTLKELARASGMSPYHLVRVFKRHRGLTPFAYQSQLRVARARGLLARGSNVQAAADLCGFYDRSHLTRVFQTIVGLTPAAYLQALGTVRR